MSKQLVVLASAILLIVVFVLGMYAYRSYQAKKYGFMAAENASTFVRDHSPTLGSDDARVYLVEFFDPACETCSAFHPRIKKLLAANRGKVKLVLRYAPFHEGSDYVVKVLEAARRQGKFWEALEQMYRTQRFWASHRNPRPRTVLSYLRNVKLDVERIREDQNDPEIEQLIEQDLADAKMLNVRKTPGFFVNGKPLSRFGYRQLQELIDAEIKEYY